MEIDLGNNIWLRSDNRCLILSEKKARQSGVDKEAWYFEDIGYYYTLPEVFKGVLRRQLRLAEAYNLQELAAAFEQTSADLEKKIDEAVEAIYGSEGKGRKKSG